MEQTTIYRPGTNARYYQGAPIIERPANVSALFPISQTDNGGHMTAAVLSRVVKMFLDDQDVRESSREIYARHIRIFFNWVSDNGLDISTLDRSDIIRYKTELLEGSATIRKHAPLTVASYLVTVHKFYAWAESYKIYPDISRGIKTPRRNQEYKKEDLLTFDETEGKFSTSKCTELLEYFRNQSARDFAIANILVRCGLRTVELIRLNVGDITYKYGRRALLVWGKGHDVNDAHVFLSDKAFESLRQYLAERGIKGDYDNPNGEYYNTPIFISCSNRDKGARISTRAIRGIIKDGLRAVGLDNRQFTAHSLRHTTAALILEAGGIEKDAQRVLRHNNPATTQIYLEQRKEKEHAQRAPELLIDNLI